MGNFLRTIQNKRKKDSMLVVTNCYKLNLGYRTHTPNEPCLTVSNDDDDDDDDDSLLEESSDNSVAIQTAQIFREICVSDNGINCITELSSSAGKGEGKMPKV